MQAADASWYPRHAHTYTNTHTRTRTQEHSGRNRKWLPKRREMSHPLRQTAFRAGSPHRKLVAPEEGSALAAIVIVQHTAQSQCTPPPPQHTHTHTTTTSPTITLTTHLIPPPCAGIGGDGRPSQFKRRSKEASGVFRAPSTSSSESLS